MSTTAYEQPLDEFMEVAGRIKYLQMAGVDYPPLLPKPMVKRLEKMGLTLKDVTPVKTALETNPATQRKIYGYYVNGEFQAAGDKYQLATHTGMTKAAIEHLVHKGPLRRGHRHSKDIHFVRICEPYAQKSGSVDDSREQVVEMNGQTAQGL
ncbi:hypothetical protein ACFOU0_12315 [Salinicoccus sesuvii]|uniref:Mor transcription activator domain-containing protein n=1 Tax=Salinicoccus sesuvii TaxID=868281 RepID=A0ABV7N6Y6_9STAP